MLRTSAVQGLPFVNEFTDLGIVYEVSVIHKLASQMIASETCRARTDISASPGATVTANDDTASWACVGDAAPDSLGV